MFTDSKIRSVLNLKRIIKYSIKNRVTLIGAPDGREREAITMRFRPGTSIVCAIRSIGQCTTTCPRRWTRIFLPRTATNRVI